MSLFESFDHFFLNVLAEEHKPNLEELFVEAKDHVLFFKDIAETNTSLKKRGVFLSANLSLLSEFFSARHASIDTALEASADRRNRETELRPYKIFFERLFLLKNGSSGRGVLI
jgi:hypothetical protein